MAPLFTFRGAIAIMFMKYPQLHLSNLSCKQDSVCLDLSYKEQEGTVEDNIPTCYRSGSVVIFRV